MTKKYYMSNVNQCHKLEDGYSKIIKSNTDGEKVAFGKLSDGWNSSSVSFVTYTDILGKEHSIPSSNIEHIAHGYSKWSLHFNPNAAVNQEAELGRLAGYVCADSNEEIEFGTDPQEYKDHWDYSNKASLLVR